MKISILALTAFLTMASVEAGPIMIAPQDGGGTGGDSCSCQSNYDCNKPVCQFNPYTQQGTCVAGPNGPPVQPPTLPPTPPPAGPCCTDPHPIPTTCEVEILIDLLDIAISGDHKFAAQAIRASFHDAGTFNVGTGEGGANGCLMTDPDFLLQTENGGLLVPVGALQAVKDNWENHPDTCVSASAADMIQFAGLVAAHRQKTPLGIDAGKIADLLQFEWGRSDEPDCDVDWCDNLPGFDMAAGANIQLRCLESGKEIKEKMMERNGFTAEESVALIGAHTVGETRSIFGGPPLKGPWVENGADNATPNGPVFDNSFHDFLTAIPANTVDAFALDQTPFEIPFPDWYQDLDAGLQHLDTDVVLAFPSQDTSINGHPHFHTFTNAFTANNQFFLDTFFAAFEKMSKLGVSDLLSTPGPCDDACAGDGGIQILTVVQLVKDLGEAKADADGKLLELQKSEEFQAQLEISTTPLRKEEILDRETALKEVETVKLSADKEDMMSADMNTEDALRAKEEEALRAEEKEAAAKERSGLNRNIRG